MTLPPQPRQDQSGLQWPKLLPGVLLQRYKRFIADVRLTDGRVVSAHCANSGSMSGCSEPGRQVYLSQSDNPKRRLQYTWEIIEMPASLVCVNTSVTNILVRRAITAGLIPALAGYERCRSEVKCGEHSRIDLVLDHAHRPPCFVEVKSCTLVEDGVARFPDAVTTRGLKHLKELQEQIRIGNRAAMFFLVQRVDATKFGPADHIDSAYGLELREAYRNGVEIFCYDVRLTSERMIVNRPVPLDL
jgi:sugar fermentation stimulation protein A